jgi:hypothetical protein
MPKELVILLLFLLVAYVVVTSGLNYETLVSRVQTNTLHQR